MSIRNVVEKTIAILIIISFLMLNNGVIAAADTMSGTDISIKGQSALDKSSAEDTASNTETAAVTDELKNEMDYLINNASALTDDDIINRLNVILDKLELKTSDERKAYTLKLSKAFVSGIGKIGSYKADVNEYILPDSLLWNKMTQVATLIDNYKSRAVTLGYTSVSDVLENDCKVITIYYENSSQLTYSINASLMSLKMLINKGFGLKVKINNDYVVLSAKNIEGIANTYIKDYSTTYVFEFVHLLNFQIDGKVSDMSTHIYDDYFDINTFGYHFAAKSYYIEYDPNDIYNRVKKEIPSYEEPIDFYMDYSNFDDQVDKNRLFSFDFSQYLNDGSIYFDNAYRFSKTSEIYVSTKSTGYHALGLFKRTFEDIKTHWAKDSIEVLASRRIVSGKSFLFFEPDSKITRAEYAALLTRILGLQAAVYNNSFRDVGSDDWYAKSIQAASDHGLINGESGYFRPNDNITREEMTTILMRAYKLVYSETVQGSTDTFEDGDEISSWALESVGGAVEKGFILGATPTTFKPKANATRAEAATILLRFTNYLEIVN